MATQESTQARFEVVGYEGGRSGRCIIETDGGEVRVAPAELIRSGQVSMLPIDEQNRIRWLAERQAAPVVH